MRFISGLFLQLNCLNLFVASFHHLPQHFRRPNIDVRAERRSDWGDKETLRSDRGDKETLRSKRNQPKDNSDEAGISSSSKSRSTVQFDRNEKGESIRQSRIGRALRDELTDIIGDIDIKATIYPDEFLLRGTSVVDIEVSPDLAYAKVFISVLGNSVERRQVYVWLCENVGQVKYTLSKRLKHMRRIPDIFFKLADTQAAADLVSVIEEVAPKSEEGQQDIDFEELGDDDSNEE